MKYDLDMTLKQLGEDEGAAMLQAIYENKSIGALLRAAKDLKPEDLEIVKNMAIRLRESYKE